MWKTSRGALITVLLPERALDKGIRRPPAMPVLMDNFIPQYAGTGVPYYSVRRGVQSLHRPCSIPDPPRPPGPVPVCFPPVWSGPAIAPRPRLSGAAPNFHCIHQGRPVVSYVYRRAGDPENTGRIMAGFGGIQADPTGPPRPAISFYCPPAVPVVWEKWRMHGTHPGMEAKIFVVINYWCPSWFWAIPAEQLKKLIGRPCFPPEVFS